MTLSEHPNLPGYYNSTHGGWAFSIDPKDDGDLDFAEESIAAWTEWRDFLLRREASEGQDTLF